MSSQTTVTPVASTEHRRHEFVLHYYDMAVKDLERHLGIGWQTIAVVGGAIASLGLAYDNKLPMPLGVSAALGISFWGVLNIIDANFWALRAIGFLANVEATYLSEKHREYLHPYVGRHPPYKLMNSLLFQYWMAALLVVVSLAAYLHGIWYHVDGSSVADTLRTVDWPTIGFWSMPAIVFLIGINLAIRTELRRIHAYLDFVESSPGPSMAAGEDSSEVVVGQDRQQQVKRDLLATRARWEVTTHVALIVSTLAFNMGLLVVYQLHQQPTP